MKKLNGRQKVILSVSVCIAVLVLICIGGILSEDTAEATDFARKNTAPCGAYLFGTDWLGRDMFARTLRGMSLSILIGVLSAAVSACMALFLGTVAAVFGRKADRMVTFLIDLVMGIPHILLLILISAALGRGLAGVVTGVALTHWTSLARLIRAEVLKLRESPYIQIAEKLGKSRWYIARKHMLPHLLPQFMVGMILLFPHAILHEASITFLGFGLSSDQPAIGNILSEAMKYLVTGQWWLALFPGLLMATVIMLFYRAGEDMKKLTDPGSAHR